jgi:hypothetical protein
VSEATTIGHLLEKALLAYEELATVGEGIEEEWSYVADLGAAWRERLEAVVGARGWEAVDQPQRAAIDRLVEEVGRIDDPHRAIDWLSTFPQAVLTALGERP